MNKIKGRISISISEKEEV